MSARKTSRGSSAGEAVIFEETWAELAPGPIAAGRSAFGEYHTHPTGPGGGAWGDAVLSTGQRGLTWRVVDDGGEPAFEACQHMPRRPALLVLDAEPALGDYTFSVPVRPLSSKAACGLAFHYHCNRTFFAVLWQAPDRLLLVRNEHDAREVLASAELDFQVDDYRTISVTVSAMKATVRVDGRKLCEGRLEPFVTGELDGPRREGKVGLIAYAPARFRAPRVTAAPTAAKARQRRLSAEHRELARLRQENPAPEPVSECGLGDFDVACVDTDWSFYDSCQFLNYGYSSAGLFIGWDRS